MTASEVMPEWPGWADVEPAIDGPEVVSAQCSSQWSGEQASGHVVESRSLSKWVGIVLSTLSMRKERIVRMWFGFDGHPPMTLLDIANAVGVKREAARMEVNSVYQWAVPWRVNVRARVLSDSPSKEHRAELALLVEKSAIARIDEPARISARAKTSAAARDRRERAKIAESMRIKFGIAMYGKAMSTMPRGEVIAYAEQWAHRYGKRWRGNPSFFYLSKWPEVSLSSPMATSCVVMAYAPDGISPLRFRRGIDLSSAA